MNELRVAVALLLQLALATPVASAAAVEDRAVCASLSLEFFPSVVQPEHTFDYNFDLVNCGSITERLVVRVAPSGPCPFIPRSKETYVLGPGQGFSISSLMIAPSCPGDYSLRGVVTFRGRRLDRDIAHLQVRPGLAGPDSRAVR
jgi:hypothetical protein